MSRDFEELDYRKTPMGELTLRRRRVALLDGLEVFEVKLGEAFLMSSLFHVVEDALADLGLGACVKGDWNVVVGGLGLGYTAVAALAHVEVRSLVVIDVLEAVIEWHQGGLVPLGAELVADPRCRLVHDDFLFGRFLWKDLMSANLGESLRRCFWTLITRRVIFCGGSTGCFIWRQGCGHWLGIYRTRESSLCGRTIHRTRNF